MVSRQDWAGLTRRLLASVKGALSRDARNHVLAFVRLVEFWWEAGEPPRSLTCLGWTAFSRRMLGRRCVEVELAGRSQRALACVETFIELAQVDFVKVTMPAEERRAITRWRVHQFEADFPGALD